MTSLDRFHIAKGDALFLDFDGTLAEIGPDPDVIRIPDETSRALERLASALDGTVAILSGRDIRDLAARVPAGLWRAGGHGLEIVGPGDPVPSEPGGPETAILDILQPVAEISSVAVEVKGPIVALHYRAAPEMEEHCIEAAMKAAACVPGHVWQAGKMVVEVKPETAHKGRALRALSARPPFAGRRPIMLGDDKTDEDAIEAALELGGIGMMVGQTSSAAQLRAPDPASVRAWLAREAQRLAPPTAP